MKFLQHSWVELRIMSSEAEREVLYGDIPLDSTGHLEGEESQRSHKWVAGDQSSQVQAQGPWEK